MTGRRVRTAILAGVFGALVVVVPTVAHADPDTDFANALHSHGIYGQKDYNAWIAKIACERLDRGVDKNAYDSAKFVAMQLQKGSTTEQAWQFVALAFQTYCPDKQVLLRQVAEQQPN